AQLLLALVRAQRRLAAQDDRPFLVRVVRVKWPLLVTRLDLVHARADQLGVGVRADPGVLEAPALALFRAIPLVSVEIEDLHAASLVGSHRRPSCRPALALVIPTAVGAPVEEGIDEWSHDRECLVERLCVRKQGSFRLPCVACFPGCAVWYIEALGKRDLSPPFFRAQRGYLRFRVNGRPASDRDKVDQIAEPSRRLL